MTRISDKKLEEALHVCYERLYAASTPPADFNELVANAVPDPITGRKTIPMDDYEISDADMDRIVKDVIKEYKIPKWMGFSPAVYLGCSPRTKKR